jgi:putative ABC transport system permease protein
MNAFTHAVSSAIRVAIARVTGVFSKDDADAELREELESHIELETAEYVRQGMDPVSARCKAILASGGMTQATEAVRDQRGLPWIESIVADFAYAQRALRRAPAFTIATVLTLALGIGANTAIFSVVRGVLLKPLPHREGDRLIYLRQSADGPGGTNISFSVPEVRDLRNGVQSIAGMAEYSPFTLTLEAEENTTRVDVGLVTGNFFDVMGLRPILGRLTDARDDGPGAAPVVILTHEFWQKRYAGDSAIVGKAVRIDGKSVSVIGVLQKAPFFPDRVDIMSNMAISPHHVSATMVEGRAHRMTEIVARLKPSATVAQASSEIATVYGRMQREYSSEYNAASHYRIETLPFKSALGERAQLTLWLLMAAAAFVLIISVANVVSLTLMRGVRRESELVVRAALGAGVSRLRRLLLVENLALTFAGALLGITIAMGGTKLLVSLAERYSTRAGEIQLDTTVLAFAFLLAFAVALMLALVASLPREGSLAGLIAAGVRRVSGSARVQRLQRGLVVAQIAVSVMLLAGAGLLTRTLVQLSNVETGLRSEEVLTMGVPLFNLARMDLAADAANKSLYRAMQEEVSALPGVRDVGLGSVMPLRTSSVRFEVKVEGKMQPAGEAAVQAEMRTADVQHFRAAGIPVKTGREFSSTDEPGGARVVVINQALADKVFQGEDPVGKRIAWTGGVLQFTPISGDWRTIVGVVQNTQDGGLDADPRPAMFMPFAQELALGGGLVIRADSNAAAFIPAVTRIVRRIAPTAPIENVMTITQYKNDSVSPQRLNAALVSSFGGVALIISIVGIAGVLAFSVGARTGEIGIRMSLGADAARVQRMILREGGALVVVGLAIGIVGAIAGSRMMQSLLFGVTPTDPVTFAGVIATMALLGLGACWIPARRASRIDPAITMRS